MLPRIAKVKGCARQDTLVFDACYGKICLPKSPCKGVGMMPSKSLGMYCKLKL